MCGRRSGLMALVALLVLTFGVGTARAAPSVSLNASPSTARVGAAVSFTATASPDSGATITGLAWNFGDGTTGSGASVSHAYGSAGTKSVTVTATESTGATASASGTVKVVGNPVAAFSFSPAVPNIGDAVSFDAGASSDPGGAISSYRWSFGDGATGSGAQTSHAYSTSGDKTVTLTITAALDGATASVTHTVHVNIPPTAAFVYAAVNAPAGQDPFTPVVGQQVAFSAQQSTDPDGSIVSYAWDLGTGTFGAPQSVPWLVTTFSTAGTKTIRLKVTDNDGATGVAQTTFRVDAPPVPGFTYSPPDPRTGQTITFTSTATDPDGAGDIASITWDLNGDGNFGDASGPTAQVVFLNPGTYTISQKVTDQSGTSRVASEQVTVTGAPAAASNSQTPTVSSPGGKLTTPFIVGGSGSKGGKIASDAIVVRALRGVRVQLTGSVTGTETDITSMVVFGPAGARIVATCHGRGCPRKAVRAKLPKSGHVRLRVLQRHLGVGAKVVVSVSKSGYATHRTTLTMRRGRAPQRLEACVVPVAGAKPKVGACPS